MAADGRVIAARRVIGHAIARPIGDPADDALRWRVSGRIQADGADRHALRRAHTPAAAQQPGRQ
jgi:hypothetical protein